MKAKCIVERTSIPVQGVDVWLAQGEEAEITAEDAAKIEAMGYVGITVELVEPASKKKEGGK